MAELDHKPSAWAVLGLHKGAGEDQIKQAFVTLVKKFDPERHTKRFMQIQAAFDRLKDPELRAREDALTFGPIRADYAFSKDEMSAVPDDKLAQAIQVLEQRLQADPNSAGGNNTKLIHGYLIRSWKNVQKRLVKEAIEGWSRVLELDPTHRRAKNNLRCAYIKLGYAYANHKLYDEAIELWEKAVQMDPENHDLIHNLALACEHAGRGGEMKRYWDQTIKFWRQRLDRSPEDDYLKNCVTEAMAHMIEVGNTVGVAEGEAKPEPEDELERNREILKLKPDDFEANLRIGKLLMKEKKWAEAAKHLIGLHKSFPRNIEVLNSLGWSHLNNQDVDTAIKTWERALKFDKNNFGVRESLVKARMQMGRALRQKNLFINALVHFKAVAKFMGESEELHYELGRTYQAKGDARSAYMEYQKVVKLNPRHKEARSGLSELKMHRN